MKGFSKDNNRFNGFGYMRPTNPLDNTFLREVFFSMKVVKKRIFMKMKQTETDFMRKSRRRG